MNIRPLSVVLLGSAMLAATPFPARAEPKSSRPDMAAAFALRAEMTTALKDRTLEPAAVIERLHAADAPMGLGLAQETEYALAVADLGQRLVAMHKADTAELFFREAESALGKALDDTPREAVANKAMLLENRAFIRNKFLNKTPEADADLAQAIALQPDNKRLQ